MKWLTIDDIRAGDIIATSRYSGRVVRSVHEGYIIAFYGGFANDTLHKGERVALVGRSIALELRQWREDIRAMVGAGVRQRAAMLVYAWNWATRPNVCLSDKEHRVCRTFAHILMKRLKRLPGWHESESGRLWC